MHGGDSSMNYTCNHNTLQNKPKEKSENKGMKGHSAHLSFISTVCNAHSLETYNRSANILSPFISSTVLPENKAALAIYYVCVHTCVCVCVCETQSGWDGQTDWPSDTQRGNGNRRGDHQTEEAASIELRTSWGRVFSAINWVKWVVYKGRARLGTNFV